ncbi:hypothetical protein [Haliea sp. E17]|uniref:hypothetical protein n=1 Tax=Haliea sp. E17 TaxID=3401576 RepID=UPI003AADF92C
MKRLTVAVLAGLVGASGAAAQGEGNLGRYSVRVYQESAAGANDFIFNYVGKLTAFDAHNREAADVYNFIDGSYNGDLLNPPFPSDVASGSRFFLVEASDLALALFIIHDANEATDGAGAEWARVTFSIADPNPADELEPDEEMPFTLIETAGPADQYTVLSGQSTMRNRWFPGFSDGAALNVAEVLRGPGGALTIEFDELDNPTVISVGQDEEFVYDPPFLLDSWSAKGPGSSPQLNLALETGRRVMLVNASPVAVIEDEIDRESEAQDELRKALEPYGPNDDFEEDLGELDDRRNEELNEKKATYEGYDAQFDENKKEAEKNGYEEEKDAKAAEVRVKDLSKTIKDDDKGRPLDVKTGKLDKKGYLDDPEVKTAVLKSYDVDNKLNKQDIAILQAELEEATKFSVNARTRSPEDSPNIDKALSEAETDLGETWRRASTFESQLKDAKIGASKELILSLETRQKAVVKQIKKSYESLTSLNRKSTESLTRVP